MARINVFMEGGVILDVQGIADGDQVVLYDYDVEGLDAERIEHDAKGEACAITTFHSDGTRNAGIFRMVW